MKTESVITKTKNRIAQNKSNIKKLACEYGEIPTKDTKKEKNILNKMKAEKAEKNQLEHLVKMMNNRKKTMKTMVWKRDKSLTENILDNLDKK